MPTQIDLPVAEQMEKRPMTPMGLLSIALSNNSGIDVIERLAALQEKAMLRDAEMQFNEAMNAAQAEIGRIAPDANNPQTKSRYATYAKLDAVLRPIYIKHGFSLSFDSGDSAPETVVAYCYVSHRAGHTRKYQSPPMPADGKGAKGGDVMTKTHATGAAMSYAMRYLLKFIFNIAVGEDDTDGNVTSGQMDDLNERLEWIANCSSMGELHKVFYAAVKVAKEANDYEAIRRLTAAKDAKKKELE